MAPRKKKETQNNVSDTKKVKEKKSKVISPFDIIGFMFQRNNKFDNCQILRWNVISL